MATGSISLYIKQEIYINRDEHEFAEPLCYI